MAFWLASRRDGQDSDWLQRFDPRFWTVNFPRPMMASVVSTGPDSLRVDAEFHRKSDLAGLIWDSEDRYDHPLLTYATDRDYTRTTLRFRWTSGGLLPLDAPNGPALTIEGRDAQGQPQSWYVRLWNYATGTPEDAEIVIPFSAILSGWSSSDPGTGEVHPGDIDRMFLSLTPPGFVPGDDGLLPERVDGWLELTGISCQGHRPMLEVGDVLLPPHGVEIATAYDDSYNLTPARLLRNLRGLGYRGRIVHYLGMSHFFRLVPEGGAMLADPTGTLCGPARRWHEAYFAACAATGYAPIASLSYELLAEHCPDAWQQRAYDGTPARTGWDPPSALLSPAHAVAMGWLRAVATHVVALQEAAGLAVLFQIGEPWWWTTGDGRICLYDPAARTTFGGAPPAIADMREALGPAQLALLDQAGALLAQSTADLTAAIRAVASAPAEVMLLAFTPTTLDAAMPELRRANMPPGWAGVRPAATGGLRLADRRGRGPASRGLCHGAAAPGLSAGAAGLLRRLRAERRAGGRSLAVHRRRARRSGGARRDPAVRLGAAAGRARRIHPPSLCRGCNHAGFRRCSLSAGAGARCRRGAGILHLRRGHRLGPRAARQPVVGRAPALRCWARRPLGGGTGHADRFLSRPARGGAGRRAASAWPIRSISARTG